MQDEKNPHRRDEDGANHLQDKEGAARRIRERKPSTPEEEAAVEEEELESFRRRKEWFEDVLGPGEGTE